LQFADRVLVLADGRVDGDGTPQQVLNAALIDRVFGVKANISSDWIRYEI
jgi:ABC-type hemin transport system ATPase subunit